MKAILPFLFLLLSLGTPLRSEEGRFIADMEINEKQKKLDVSDRRLKMLQTQFRGMTQTIFRSEEDRFNYERRKAEIQGQISQLEPEVKDLNETLGFLKKRRALFPNSETGQKFDYFFAPPVDIKAYEAGAQKIVPVLEKIFPLVSLSSLSRPQVLIYKTKEDYQAFERAPKDLLKHPVFQRACGAGTLVQVMGLGNRRMEYIAICQERGLDAFHHEIAHLFLDRFMNPSLASVMNQKASPFLEEGFAENIASVSNETGYEEKVRSLSKAVATGSAKDLTALINADSFLADSGSAAWNESTVFVRWVSSLSNGFQLLRQLFTSRNNEHETAVRTFQSSLGLPRNGFEGYYLWRSNEFDRVQHQLAPSAETPH